MFLSNFYISHLIVSLCLSVWLSVCLWVFSSLCPLSVCMFIFISVLSARFSMYVFMCFVSLLVFFFKCVVFALICACFCLSESLSWRDFVCKFIYMIFLHLYLCVMSLSLSVCALMFIVCQRVDLNVSVSEFLLSACLCFPCLHVYSYVFFVYMFVVLPLNVFCRYLCLL